MAGLNKITLIGNLGKDPEVKSLESGRSVANFSLATSESYKNKQGERVDSTEWHNVVLWSPLAEIAQKYLKKGSKIYVEGKVSYREYEDNEGVKRRVTDVIGNNFIMLDSKESSDSTSGEYNKREEEAPY